MKKSELKALIREVVQENFAINHAMTKMVDKQERQKKEEYYKSKLEQYHQAAKGHWPEKDEYKSDVISLGKNLGYSDSEIHQDLNRYTKPEDEPAMNNFIFESKLKALIRKVVKEAMFPPMNMAVMRAIQDSGSGISVEDLKKNGFVLSNIGGLVCWKKGNLLVYSTPTPDNKDTQWRVTTQDVRGDEIPHIPYEKNAVKNMNDVLKWEKTINSKKA